MRRSSYLLAKTVDKAGRCHVEAQRRHLHKPGPFGRLDPEIPGTEGEPLPVGRLIVVGRVGVYRSEDIHTSPARS